MLEQQQKFKTISVVIPAFNAGKFIRATIESVLAQTYPATEVIVVDDGSNDDTREVVRSFGEKVVLIEQRHSGVSAARNVAIQNANGEYIAFLDADDLWLPEKLEHQMYAIAKGSHKWVYCDPTWFDDALGKMVSRRYPKRHEGYILEKLFLDCFIASPTPILHKSVFEEVGSFHEETMFGEDWDMWLRVAAVYPIKYVKKRLAIIRLHASSVIELLPRKPV